MEGIRDSNPDVRAHAKKVLYAQKQGQECAVAPKAGMADLPVAPQAEPVTPAKIPATSLEKEQCPKIPGFIFPSSQAGTKMSGSMRSNALLPWEKRHSVPSFTLHIIPTKPMRIGALQALSRFGTMGAPYIVKALEDPRHRCPAQCIPDPKPA